MIMSKLQCGLTLAVLLISSWSSDAFAPGAPNLVSKSSLQEKQRKDTSLKMAMDMVTYLRTEWIAAALCTNQTPRSADTCLQLGTEDGRAVTFVPRTIRTLLTSSAEKDGKIGVGVRRQLKKNEEIRKCAKVKIIDQAADDLTEVEDNSVDVVISFDCASRLLENGRDWKLSIREACRVLKPGGRFLWVEQTTVGGEDYETYLENLYTQAAGGKSVTTEEAPEEEGPEFYPTFDDIGWDDVNLVLVPHTAGVAVKSFDPSITIASEAELERDRMSDLSMKTFERGIKKRKKKKKKKKEGEE
jgi:SAM-dependent methyltransferase